MSGGNFEGRQRNFMKAGDLEELKLKREWQSVELRKSARTEIFMKKRRLLLSSNPQDIPLCAIDSQLAYIRSSVPFPDPYPHLLTLEGLSSRGDPAICIKLVEAGMVPLILGEFHPENSNRASLLTATQVICDLLTSLPSQVHVNEVEQIFENAAKMMDVDEVKGGAMLIIGNVLMDGYHHIPAPRIYPLADKVLDALELPTSDHSLTGTNLFALACFLSIPNLPIAILNRSVDTITKYCSYPYEPEYASELIRGLTILSEDCQRPVIDPRVVKFLLCHMRNFPEKMRAYELIATAFSSGKFHIDSSGLVSVLEDLVQSEQVAVRRLAYKLLWESADFYQASKEQLTESPLWRLAVKGVSDHDEDVQIAATSFYLCFGTNFAYKYMEIAEDLVVALMNIQTAKGTELQLVTAMQSMMELLLHLIENGETHQRHERSRFGSIVTTKIDELGLMEHIERFTYSDNKEVVDKAFDLLLAPSDTLISLEDAIPPTTGFVFS